MLVEYNAAHVAACGALGVRHDGRGLCDGREVEVVLFRGEDVGVAEASVGGTRCVALARAGRLYGAG